MMDLDINTKWPEKPKRTISLEAYIKMQCDVACMLRANGQSFNQSGAKEMVDMILEHNNVEVEK